MVNQLHRWLHPVSVGGWDPIPAEVADQYDRQVAGRFDPSEIDRLVDAIGSLQGRKVLDLGGGPGQYTIELAKRGALVTWHDISQQYLARAREKAQRERLEVNFSLGYLEDAGQLAASSFDVIFNRVCWYYSISDQRFARLLWRLTKDGGTIYVSTDLESDSSSPSPLTGRVRTKLYHHCGIKIGHPFPPRGKVPSLFLKLPVSEVRVKYRQLPSGRIFEDTLVRK